MRMKRLLPLMSTLLLATNLLAQTTTATPDDTASPAVDAATGAAAGLAALGCGVIPCVIWFAIIIGLAMYVYKDAKKRGMDNAVLLTIVTVFTGPLGLIIYLLMRPKDVPPTSGM